MMSYGLNIETRYFGKANKNMSSHIKEMRDVRPPTKFVGLHAHS
jgi:hypothetical protein